MLEDDFFAGTKTYNTALDRFCLPLKKLLGVTYAMYFNIDKNNQAIHICTDQEWTQKYVENKYYNIDPLLVDPNNMHNGFAFNNACGHKDFKNLLLYDAEVNFNLCHSFVYVEKIAGGGYFGIGFATDPGNYKISELLLNERDIVKLTIRELNKNIVREISNLDEKRMYLPDLKKDLFFTQKGLVFNEIHRLNEKVKFLKSSLAAQELSDADDLLGVKLSPQEIRCLREYMVVKNIKNVAKNLQLSALTVSSYMENIKNKLFCCNKVELMKKGSILESLGII